MPAVSKHLRHFGDSHEIGFVRLQDIQSDRELRVGGLYEDEPLAQVLPGGPFLVGDGAQNEWTGIAVDIEEYKPASGFDVLPTEVPQERRLARSRFPEDHNMLFASRGSQCEVTLCDLPLHDERAQIQTVTSPYSVPP